MGNQEIPREKRVLAKRWGVKKGASPDETVEDLRRQSQASVMHDGKRKMRKRGFRGGEARLAERQKKPTVTSWPEKNIGR